jgi:hypothetical protein
LERISRTTCSTRCCSAGEASSNNRCASSKKNTIFGWSRSPTSGSCEHVDDAAPAHVLAHQVGQFQGRLAEELVGAVAFEFQDRALDRRDALRADQSVLGRDGLGVVGGVGEQRAQIGQVEQQPALVVGGLEDHLQHAFLGVVQFQHAAEQGGAHLADGGAHRMAELAVDVPEHHRVGLCFPVGELELGQARLELVARLARGHREARQVALGVGQEARHAEFREAFGQHHQRNGFAGAGGAGDHPVAVAVMRVEVDAGAVVAADQDLSHGVPSVAGWAIVAKTARLSWRDPAR